MSARTKKGKSLDWKELSEAQLKGALLRRNLDTMGTKDELVKRAKESINLDVKENATKLEDDVDYFLKRSRMYHGHNLAVCLRTVVITPFNKEVLACECFQGWVEEASVCRMGKNADGKSGVLLKFKYTEQGDGAYIELKSELAPHNISVCHPKHPSIERDQDEVLDILNEPLAIYPLQAVTSDRVGLARRAVVLEKVPTSLLAEERLAPYFPEAIDLFIYPNYNKKDTGIVVLEFATDQDVNSFLELEQQTMIIEGERIVPKRYTTASHKYLKMFLKAKKQDKVELDDETRVAMCKEFISKEDTIRAIVDGDEHFGLDKLKACDKNGEHISDIKRAITADTERRIRERELKMPEPEEFILRDTKEALKKAAEEGVTQKEPKVAQKRVLPKEKPVSEGEPKVTKKYILPKLKPLPAKPTKAKPTTAKPLASVKKTATVKHAPVSGKQPAKVKSLMDTIVFKGPHVQPLIPKSKGLLGDTPIEMKRAAFRNPTNLNPQQSERWQDADQKPFLPGREPLLEQQRTWPDSGVLHEEREHFRDTAPQRSALDSGALPLGREHFGEPATQRLGLGAGSLLDDREHLLGAAEQVPLQAGSTSLVSQREQFNAAAAEISARGLPRQEAASLMDDLALVFVSRLEKLKQSKQEAQESVNRFYKGADVNPDIASSKKDLMPVGRSFRDGDSMAGGPVSRENLMQGSRSFRDGDSRAGSGLNRESLMPSSRSFRDGDSAFGSRVGIESLMPSSRSFRDEDSAGDSGSVKRESLIPGSHSFREEGSTARSEFSRESLMPGSHSFRDEDMPTRSGFGRDTLMLSYRGEGDRDTSVDSGFGREKLLRSNSGGFRSKELGGASTRLDRDDLMPSGRRFGVDDSSLHRSVHSPSRVGVPRLEGDDFPARGVTSSRVSLRGHREEVVGSTFSGGRQMPDRSRYYDIEADNGYDRGSLGGSRAGTGSMDTGLYKSSQLTKGSLARSARLY